MDISHFFQSIGDELGKVFGLNPVLENIIVMKAAILLIAISLLISSMALLILALSHHKFKRSLVIQRIVKWFFRAAVVIVGAGALIPGFEHFSELTVAAVGSIFTAVSLALVIGYYAAGGERRDRIIPGLTASLGNLAVVMLVARVSYPGEHVLHTTVVNDGPGNIRDSNWSTS
ncbi:MAG: hypothetical protein ABSG91_01270 [Syntrophobacteraceae bacterium]